MFDNIFIIPVTFPHFPNLFTCSSKSNPQMYLSHHILFLKYLSCGYVRSSFLIKD